MTRVDTTELSEILPARALLGEGILWDSRRQLLWWTDIPGKTLHRYEWRVGTTRVLETPDRIGSFGLIAESEHLIAAFATGIADYDPYRGSLAWLARPDGVGSGIRFNDGRVDHRGRFWTGTMVENSADPPTACLYSFDATKGLRSHVRGVKISNGLCTSPDGKILYFADSPTRTIWAYDLLEPEGTLGVPRIFARSPEGAFPDGSAVDSDGCVWSAHWGASSVVRYTPDGRVDRTVAVPTRQPSCVCFGGPDLDVLCITTARVDLDAASLASEPNAGDVFLYRVGARGLPEPEYRP